MEFILSQDLGKMRDYHASVLTQVVFNHEKDTNRETHWVNRHIDEVPIRPEVHVIWIGRNQDPYNKLVSDTKIRLQDRRLFNNCYHVVDATGVGMPVLEMMREERLSPIGVWITGGVATNNTNYGYTVPKSELISSLQMALSTEQLKFSDQLDSELVSQLRHEFQQFTEKKTKMLGTTYEAWREADHDDLVLSLAMNVWWALRTIARPRRPVEFFQQPTSMDDYDPLASL
jgi:hypothetical protein